MKFDVFGNRLASGMVYFTVSIHLERSTFSDLREIRRPLICLGTMCGGRLSEVPKRTVQKHAIGGRRCIAGFLVANLPEDASGYSSWLAISDTFSKHQWAHF